MERSSAAKICQVVANTLAVRSIFQKDAASLLGKWMCTARAGENDQNQRRQEYWLLELTVYGGKITEARVRVCRSLSTFVGLCRVVGLSVASEPEGEGQGRGGQRRGRSEGLRERVHPSKD